jgi:hypothetical protein
MVALNSRYNPDSAPARSRLTPRYPRLPRRWRRRGVAIAASLAALPALARPVGAQTVNWTGGNGYWDVAANWSSSPNLPGSASNVINWVHSV